MNPETRFWRRLFPLACGACAIVITPAYGDILYAIPTFATGPGGAGKSYDPALVTITNHAGVTGSTAAQLLTLQNLNPNAGTAIGSPRFQNNVTVDANQTLGTLVTDVGNSGSSYFQFGATAATPGDLYLSSVSFDTRRATTSTGTDRKYTVQVSINNGAYTTVADQVAVSAIRGATASHADVPLLGAAYQGVTSADFRVFTIGAGAMEYTNVAINGTLTAAAPSVGLTSSILTYTGGTFVLAEQNGAVIDTTGITATLTTDTGNVPATVTATKTAGVTTAKVSAAILANKVYNYTLTVPKGSGAPQVFSGALTSYRLPNNLAGLAGTVGTWGIREYNTNAANTIQTAINAIGTNPAFVEASYPVFNHSDPDTNSLTSDGNFNNDFPILLDGLGDQSFVVVGKTKVTVPAAGDYTFAVHSDDGFAMRVVGPSGGRFISTVGGAIDTADTQTVYFDGGTGDSNVHGVYHFDAAGTYDITYLGYDGGGGAFYEVAWAPGVFTEDRQTNLWTLVGNPNDPSVPPYQVRYAANLPGPTGTAGNWGIRTYLNADVGSTMAAASFLAGTSRLPTDADGLTIDAQRKVLNANDPQSGGAYGEAFGDQPFPGDTPADDNHVVTIAKSRINVTTAGFYTFQYIGDDGFFMRIKGVGTTPTPAYRTVTGNGNFQMSHPNEWYADSNGATRAVISLQVGSYDLEYVQYEGTGDFSYELVAAPGEWATGIPTNGWQLVGSTTTTNSVAVPKIAAPGWSVETSTPNIRTIDNNIDDADAALFLTQNQTPVPTGALTTWTSLNFTDPEMGNEGQFSPSNPFPLNTPAADTNYAMRATGQLVITVPGEYHLGYQGDDGGYMIINGPGNPFFKSIVVSNHPTVAVLREEEIGLTGRNNMMLTQTATPNSRTIGAVDLVAGTYTIKTLYFQGTGNSFWEVIGAQAPDSVTFKYPLLATDGPTTATVPTGLALVEQTVVPVNSPFAITGFSTTGSPASAAHFTFSSANAGTYTVQVSTDLVNWSTISATITDNGNGTSSVNANFSGQTVNVNQPIVGQPKLFVRMVRTF